MKLGIDLGGTKIEICVLEEGKELIRHRVATPKNDYSAILHSIQQLVFDVDEQLKQKLNVGIGTPGALSPSTGLLRNSNTVCMNGKPLLEDLQQLLQRPVKIQNDANCFALSEAVDGAGKGHDLVFGVIIGTGTGGGIVYQQKPFLGRHAIAGEWGHNPLPWQTEDDQPLQPCYCGKHGCIETFLSGPGMAQGFKLLHQKSFDSHHIVERAEAGDKQCIGYMQLYIDRLARALAHVVNIIDPDIIVLGGGMSNIKSLYSSVPKNIAPPSMSPSGIPSIHGYMAHYVFSDHVTTPIVAAVHGDSSGVRGAAELW